MFERLKNLMAELVREDREPRDFADDDYRVAAASLLIHVADIDGEIAASEQQRIKNLVTGHFGLDAAASARLIATAERVDRESVDLYHFTSVLKRVLDPAGRRKVIEMMWEIAYADGKVGEFEENLVWRVAELLGISSRDRISLRQEVAAAQVRRASGRPSSDEEFLGPWAPKPVGEQ